MEYGGRSDMQKNKITIVLLIIIAMGVSMLAFLQIEKHREEVKIKQQEQELIKKVEADMKKTLEEPPRKIADGTGVFP